MRNLHKLALITVVAIGVSGCNQLAKMKRNANKVTYTVTPNPLEYHNDSVALNITAQYPEKYFDKRTSLTITPVIRHETGEAEYRSYTAIGESVEGAGHKVNYSGGGSVSYSDKVAYTPGMRWSEVELRAMGTRKNKTLDFGAIKVADATITTPLLVRPEDLPIAGKDEFQRITQEPFQGRIYYPIQQSNISTGFRHTGSDINNNEETKQINDFLRKVRNDTSYTVTGVSIAAYASPDGPYELNERLSRERANTSQRWVSSAVTQHRRTPARGATAVAGRPSPTDTAFYQKTNTPEDWEGFRELINQSQMENRDMIIRVLEMHEDVSRREEELKNMAATYDELRDRVLPKLRRSRITINAERVGRSDEQITDMARTQPDSLSANELMYAATLTEDTARQIEIYRASIRRYPEDWRGYNNLARIYISQENYTEARSNLEQADQRSPNNPVIQNNLGVTARRTGDIRQAELHFISAEGAGPEVNLNRGVVAILRGNYDGAVRMFGDDKSFNAALAQLLAGDSQKALSTLEASPANNTAHGAYLKAVIGARMNNQDMVVTNLSTAVSRDPSLKDFAKKDMEFLKFMETAAFKNVVQ
jgi:tetratricopeptide (TPR) repeat protein/outer membrane protein OmpA-like peptidoglycan-associated protein